MPQLQNPQLAAERSDPLRGIGRSSRRTEPVPRANRADGSLAGAEVLAWPDPARASSAPPIPTGHRIRSLGSPETARATDSPCHRLSMPQTPHATDPHATSRAQHRPRRVEEQTRRGRAMDRRLSRRLEQSRSARVVVARQHYSDRNRLGFLVSARELFPYPRRPEAFRRRVGLEVGATPMDARFVRTDRSAPSEIETGHADAVAADSTVATSIHRTPSTTPSDQSGRRWR